MHVPVVMYVSFSFPLSGLVFGQAEEMTLWNRHSWPSPVDEDVEQTSGYVPVPVRLMSCFNASAQLCESRLSSRSPVLSTLTLAQRQS